MTNSKCEKHNIRTTRCAECGGSDLCQCESNTEKTRLKFNCKKCNPSAFCPCGVKKAFCFTCKGSQICLIHNQRKSRCTGCMNGTELCQHNNRRDKCKECR